MSDGFNILVATDIHLGYKEKDSIRCNDSLVTFEEILQLAIELKVDFILLGGDLFHDNKPTRKTLYQTMNLLREYCFGTKLHDFEFLTDPNDVFSHCKFPTTNYQDQNINVKVPIFSIHGNHDDPVGVTGLCSLDILSTCGYVNYFGKFTQIEQLDICPLLFKKNKTKLAIYGLGSIRDERLHQIYKEERVALLQPEEEPNNWFNLMVIHQNRYKRGSVTSYIPEQFIDKSIDLVIWGHEHECLIEPMMANNNEFYISQPGSSIATSLEKGEAVQKKVALLQIKEKSFKIIPIPLQTVRPFVYGEVVLADTTLDPSREDIVMNFLTEKVMKMIEKSQKQFSGNPNQPKLPLIRLKVDYTGGYPIFKNSQFSTNIAKLVANPDSVFLFKKKHQFNTYDDSEHIDNNLLYKFTQNLNNIKIEDLIEEFLKNKDNNEMQLDVLSSKLLIKALNEFVCKDEKDSIQQTVSQYIQELHSKLVTNFEMKSLDEEIRHIRQQLEAKCEKSTFLAADYVPQRSNDLKSPIRHHSESVNFENIKDEQILKEKPLKRNQNILNTNQQELEILVKKPCKNSKKISKSNQKENIKPKKLTDVLNNSSHKNDSVDVTNLPFLNNYSHNSSWNSRGL